MSKIAEFITDLVLCLKEIVERKFDHIFERSFGVLEQLNRQQKKKNNKNLQSS